jgi:hypothetical protein
MKRLTLAMAAVVVFAGSAGAEIRRCPQGGYWYDTETGERVTGPSSVTRVIEPEPESDFDYSQWEAKPTLWYDL